MSSPPSHRRQGIDLIALAWLSYTAPRKGARVVLDLNANLSAQNRWSAFTLVAVLSSLVAVLSGLVMQIEGVEGILTSPLFIFAVNTLTLLFSALIIHWLGQWSKNERAPFADALILSAWLAALTLPLNLFWTALHAAAGQGSGGFWAIEVLTSIALNFWLAGNFAAELHKFRSFILTALGMIGLSFLSALGLGLVIAFLAFAFLPSSP